MSTCWADRYHVVTRPSPGRGSVILPARRLSLPFGEPSALGRAGSSRRNRAPPCAHLYSIRCTALGTRSTGDVAQTGDGAQRSARDHGRTVAGVRREPAPATMQRHRCVVGEPLAAALSHLVRPDGGGGFCPVWPHGARAPGELSATRSAPLHVLRDRQTEREARRTMAGLSGAGEWPRHRNSACRDARLSTPGSAAATTVTGCGCSAKGASLGQ